MERKKWQDIRVSAAELPSLRTKLASMSGRIAQAEDEKNKLFEAFQKEALDVEKLESESLSSMLLRLIGKLEQNLEKETHEMIKAKVAYDRASLTLAELQRQEERLKSRILQSETDLLELKEELKRREALIQAAPEAVKTRFGEIEDQRAAHEKELAETMEALHAAENASETCRSMVQSLDDAYGWATWDTWTRGGILSHMAKYSHLDDAEAAAHQLKVQLETLVDELGDTHMSAHPIIEGIDGSTRTWDFWFDNIFTDLSVRAHINEDIQRANNLSVHIGHLTGRLEAHKTTLIQTLDKLERDRETLLIEN